MIQKGKKEMEKLFNTTSIGCGIAGGILSYFFGGWDMMLVAIVALAALDYLTGILKGIYTRELSSEIGFRGLLRKIAIFIVIAVAVIIQRVVNDAAPLREVVIAFYICNEGLSLMENAAIFIPLPPRLKDVLLQLRDKSESEE